MADRDAIVLAHWYTRLHTFSFSAQQFYERLHTALMTQKIPNLKVSRVALAEGKNFMGHTRDYLRLQRDELTFDICAAPFGIDFFVSWWLLEKPGCLSGCIAIFFPFIRRSGRTTYYQEDTAIMFREVVHQAVLETVDEITKGTPTPWSGNRVPEIRRRLL